MTKLLDIGARLKEERRRLGMNQADFAALGDAGRASQFNYESGERSPDASYLAAIAEAGADIGYIVTGRHSTPNVAQGQETGNPASSALEKIDRQLMERIFNMLEQAATKAGKRWTDKRKLSAAIEIYNFSVEGEVDDANIERALRLVVNR